MIQQDKFINWCEREIVRLQGVLNLQGQNITFNKNPDGCEDSEAWFDIGLNYPYTNCEIAYNKKTINVWKKNRTEVTRYLVHELVHILIDPVGIIAKQRFTSKDDINNAEETLADKLSFIFIKLI